MHFDTVIPDSRIAAHVACGQTNISEWGLDENADGNLAFTPEAAVTLGWGQPIISDPVLKLAGLEVHLQAVYRTAISRKNVLFQFSS